MDSVLRSCTECWNSVELRTMTDSGGKIKDILYHFNLIFQTAIFKVDSLDLIFHSVQLSLSD